ncbi:MAG TPA: ABC transporter ATP-binding protein, partial [Steroidobacteraceae bacterium]|nr:ABC transporter ATP-binding protein [Steroidobacteraceae bacterium]
MRDAALLGESTAPAPVLDCRNLAVSYFYGGRQTVAVVDFNLTLRPGEAHGLVGESGCGKSTVALAIMRHLAAGGRITAGEILFEGRDLLRLDREALRRVRGAGIAMVYQEPMASLNPSLTIARQLTEVPVCHEGVSQHEALTRARSMLDMVQLADAQRIMRSYPHQISGGQQQRVVIAMALLSRPKVLLLDEPTTALDVTVEAGIVDLIREIAARFGMAMLYISHNLGLVRETCDRMTVMYAGEAVEVGAVEDVFRAMRHPYTRGLFAALPSLAHDKRTRPLRAIPGQLPSPGSRPAGCVFGPRCGDFVAGQCDTTRVALRATGTAADSPSHLSRCLRIAEIDWDAAPSPSSQPPALGTGRGATLLRVRDLTKHYRHVIANDRLTFDVSRGETVAIVGESGSGKSTFARVAMGLAAASAGSIQFEDLELAQLLVTHRSRPTLRALQMIFQNPFETLNPQHTVGAQIERVIRKFKVEHQEWRVRSRMLELLELVKLPRAVAQQFPGELSGGQKQRVAVARAFAANPELVIADEPLSALDASVQTAVTELLLDLQREQGTAVVFISHDLAVVRHLAER